MSGIGAPQRLLCFRLGPPGPSTVATCHHHEECPLTDPHPTDPIFSVLAAADELGVELDEAEAREWISAVSRQASGPLVVDVDTGIYGHHITMSDLDQSEIGRFRHLASIVGLEDRPPAIVTALALSGSAAQNRVHRFPGDCDFFERVTSGPTPDRRPVPFWPT